MRRIYPLLLAAILTLSCGGGSSPSAPSSLTPSSSTGAAFAGAWSGMANDSQGATSISWSLAQTGASVTGTVKTQSINPDDGSCNSCHRNKSGVVSGTISNNVISVTMTFAAGLDGDPTPICSATMTGSVSSAPGGLSGSYTGSDTCEGAFAGGTVSLNRG